MRHIWNAKRWWWTALLLAVSVGLAGGGQQRAGENRADVEGMMEAYVLSKLQDSLDLTDEQFGDLVVLQKKLQDSRRDYRRDRTGMLRKMRQTLRVNDGGEQELQSLLTQLDSLRDDFAVDEKERYQAIDDVLSIRQRARYRILEVELQRRLTEMMRQVRGRRNDARPFEE